MKKFLICAALVAVIAGIAVFFGGNKETSAADGRAAYLRIHIRANSNGKEDQAVKYLVRDKIVEFLTPAVAECRTKEEAVKKIGSLLPEAEREADCVLRANGYTYGARASIRQEQFPTRVYEGVTLDAGVYDALIVELGTGEGDNWWCVVYPPLCFSGGNGNVIYKSKIAEIIEKFYQRS